MHVLLWKFPGSQGRRQLVWSWAAATLLLLLLLYLYSVKRSSSYHTVSCIFSFVVVVEWYVLSLTLNYDLLLATDGRKRRHTVCRWTLNHGRAVRFEQSAFLLQAACETDKCVDRQFQPSRQRLDFRFCVRFYRDRYAVYSIMRYQFYRDSASDC